MSFKYISDELLNKINHNIFSNDDIKKYILDLVSKLGINDYLKDIVFVDNMTDLAIYDFYTCDLKINMHAIIEDACEFYDRDDDEEKVLFININILMCIIHEIVHTSQNYYINTSDNPVYIFMEKEIRYILVNPDKYDNYYNFFSFEREAIITSYETILYIIKSRLNNDALFEYFRDSLIKILLGGYKKRIRKVVSPAETVTNKLMKVTKSFPTKNNIYEVLKYGEPISKKDYIDFKNNSNKYLSKNNLHA